MIVEDFIAIARIHQLEAILTKFVKNDISKQFNGIKQELEKKNTLCCIIEKQNEELTDTIIKLEQDLLTERQKKYINEKEDDANEDEDEEDDKRMRCSIKELMNETNRLSELLNCTQHEKTELKTSFIELNVENKNNENIIVQLKESMDLTINKKNKVEFQNRALRLKLRDAISFQELYYKLKNKNIADKKHFENGLNELKTTHWNTLKELSKYKEKDMNIKPLQIEIKKYKEKYEKVEDDFVSQENKNKMLEIKLKEIESNYFKSKKEINDLQNDNHKLMVSNKKLLNDCMKYDTICRNNNENLKKKSFIEIGIKNNKLSPRNTYLNNKKDKVPINISTTYTPNNGETNLNRCNIIYHWTIEHVGEWLKENLPKILTHQAKLAEYIDKFRRHGIDGNKLLLLDKVALDLIGIDNENIERVLNCIANLHINPIMMKSKLIETNDKQTQTLYQFISDKTDCISLLSFTDTKSDIFSPQSIKINNYNNTCNNENENDYHLIKIELKTVKRKKNQLIVSIKMLSKQLRKCKVNKEDGKYNTLKIEIDKKQTLLIQIKQQIMQLKQNIQKYKQPIIETKVTKPFIKPFIKPASLNIPTTTKNIINESDHEEKTNVSDKLCVFGGNINSTISSTQDKLNTKTFNDIISDTESIIHNLKISDNFRNQLINNKTSSISMDEFVFLDDDDDNTTKSKQLDKITDEYDPTFSRRIANPFINNLNQQQTTKVLMQKIAMIQQATKQSYEF